MVDCIASSKMMVPFSVHLTLQESGEEKGVGQGSEGLGCPDQQARSRERRPEGWRQSICCKFSSSVGGDDVEVRLELLRRAPRPLPWRVLLLRAPARQLLQEGVQQRDHCERRQSRIQGPNSMEMSFGLNKRAMALKISVLITQPLYNNFDSSCIPVSVSFLLKKLFKKEISHRRDSNS